MRLKSYLVVLHICVRWSYSRLESRSSPASPIISSVPWTGAVLGRLISVSMNNLNKSDVTTQEMSPTVEDTQSKIMSTVEIAANESSNVTPANSFTTTVSSDKTVHELRDLMARPTLLASGKITSSNNSEMVFGYDLATYENMSSGNIPGFIEGYSFPNSILASNPVVAAKIQNFTFFKADIKFDLKINCPPNVSGALMLVYMPLVDNLPFDYTNMTYQGLTSYPSKILDYSVDTSISMTVPYINEYDYYNRYQSREDAANGTTINTSRPYGAIVIFNLQKPLSSSTADFVSYTAFASFENVELALPATSGNNTTTYTHTPDTYFTQSGSMVQRIPGRDILSGSASSSDTRLSYNTTPPKGDVVTYDSDEMSLDYVLKRENIIGRIAYSSGRDARNSSYLGKVRCFPKRPVIKPDDRVSESGYDYYGKPVRVASQMGTFDYVSNLFGRYTGSVKIGMRLIKTKFHYGRIAVIFDPFNKLERVSDPSVGTLLSTNYSMVIDLNGNDGMEGGSNYYSVNVPYINNAGYSLIGNRLDDPSKPSSKNVAYTEVFNTTNPDDGMTRPFTKGREEYNPYLRFYALTELGYLSSAADEVPILVSISAGEDYKLSVPRVSVRIAPPPQESDEYYAQSGLTLVPQTTSTSTSNTSHCNGESISSLKELANRFTPLQVPAGWLPDFSIIKDEPSSTGLGGLEQVENDNPPGYILSLHRNTLPGEQLSNYEAIAALYRFSYGGRRYKLLSSEKAWMMARLLHSPASNGLRTGKSMSRFYNLNGSDNPHEQLENQRASVACHNVVPLSGEMVVDSSINNMLEVERPFYSNRKLISTVRATPRVTRNSNGWPVATPTQEFCEDEVLTQLVAISQDPTQMTLLDYTNSLDDGICLGPSYVEQYDHLPDDDSYTARTLQPRKYERGGAKYPRQSNGQYHVSCLSFTERTLIAPLAFRNYANGPVLEAMGTGAGCTFLQAPPCVIFGISN